MKTVQQAFSSASGSFVQVAPGDSVRDAIALLAKHDCGALPVIDGDTLVGVLTERDYVHKVALCEPAPADMRVEEVMSQSTVVVDQNATLQQCLEIMGRHQVRHLPVVDRGRVQKVLSMQQIVVELVREEEDLIDTAIRSGREASSYLRVFQRRALADLVAPHGELGQSLQSLGHVLADTPSMAPDLAALRAPFQRGVEALERLSRWYASSRELQHARVLLAEDIRREQVVARLALGGTGLDLDVVSEIEEARRRIADNAYDIVCLNENFIQLADQVHERNPHAQMVFLTSDAVRDYLPLLRDYPMLSNIVSRSDDREFTVRSILVTISKLASGDIFGIDKYLTWGFNTVERPVRGTQQRKILLGEMQGYFRNMGIRLAYVDRCVSVAEELLCNAIYSAPRDAEGRRRYEGMSRGDNVELAKPEEAVLRYTCDGIYAAVSVSDPFGSFTRDRLLESLQACRDHESGGNRQGLFMAMETADLMAIIVERDVRTEVIALFNVDLRARRRTHASSFHYFCE